MVEPHTAEQFLQGALGVSAAANEDNNIIVGFSWAPNSDTFKSSMNKIRTFNCKVEDGELNRKDTIYGNETTRIQPALAYDSNHYRFVMAWRGQDFNTTLNVMRKSPSATSWTSKVHLGDKRSHVAPALAYSRENNELVMWYVFE